MHSVSWELAIVGWLLVVGRVQSFSMPPAIRNYHHLSGHHVLPTEAILPPSGHQKGWGTDSHLCMSIASTSKLKKELLQKVAGVNRGLSCTGAEQEEIVAIVEELEANNPSPTPNEGFADGTSPLAGEWKLLYTTALDVLSLGLLPGIEVGQVFQNINEDGTEIANIVDLQPNASPVLDRFIGDTSARLKVLATSALEGDKRLTLSFRSSQYLPQSLLGRDVTSVFPDLKIQLPQLPNAGWVDTTYVDDDIRVARAFGGNLFVLERA